VFSGIFFSSPYPHAVFSPTKAGPSLLQTFSSPRQKARHSPSTFFRLFCLSRVLPPSIPPTRTFLFLSLIGFFPFFSQDVVSRLRSLFVPSSRIHFFQSSRNFSSPRGLNFFFCSSFLAFFLFCPPFLSFLKSLLGFYFGIFTVSLPFFFFFFFRLALFSPGSSLIVSSLTAHFYLSFFFVLHFLQYFPPSAVWMLFCLKFLINLFKED